MTENKIPSGWEFLSHIIWVRNLVELIESFTKVAPDIIIQTIGSETLSQYLFVFCIHNKKSILNLKPSKDLDELMNIAFYNQSLRDAGKDEHYSNNYELNKTLTKQYLKSEIESLQIKCENKNFKAKMRAVKKENSELISELTSMNRILEVAQTKIKRRKKEEKELTFDSAIKLNPEFKNIVFSGAEKCRFNNGKINTSKLGRMFGVDHKTVKGWCQKLNIPLKRPPLS